MTKFDYETMLSEAKITAYKVKAIADAFAHEYVDNVEHTTAAIIETDPESYIYLFTAMHDTLCDVCRRLDELEDAKIEAAG